MLERLWIVFAKESVANLRDRRSLTMALAYPFIGSVLVGALIAYLEAKGARVIEAPLNPAYAVRTGQFDTALIIPPNYAARFGGGREAAVHLVVDGSRLSAVVAMSWALAALGDYNAEVSHAWLDALGLDAAVAVPLKIDKLNVAVGRNLTGFFLNMMPPFLIFTIFIGGVFPPSIPPRASASGARPSPCWPTRWRIGS